MQRYLISILLSAHMSLLGAQTPEKPANSVEKPATEAPAKEVAEKLMEPIVREGAVMIAGKKVPYQVTTAKIQIKGDDGKPRASIFHVSYTRTDTKEPSTRPVLFAFNGGPGSSSVWLHIGVLGPKIVNLPGDGTTAAIPPAVVVENPHSILDVCDLVFIDPVSTGYSRAEKEVKADEFHGVDEDIEAVGNFIRRWVTEHSRWSSPKFVLGESYGGIRAAGLSNHLQTRYGMNLNGVVLLSSLMDYATIQPSRSNEISYATFLGSFTGAAHYHHKIQGDREALIKESNEFAFGEYATALLKGNDLDAAARQGLAEKLARLTGVSATTWLNHDLRMHPTFFRAELLRKEGKVIGRFDARVAWDTTDKSAASAEYDPSYALSFGAFSSAMLDYLGRDLGCKEDQPYEILSRKVQPWRWTGGNQVVDVSDRLANAMADNPHLRVLIMGGHTDLATPPAGTAYSVRHMRDLPAGVRSNISTTYYDGGHMFYLNPPDRTKCREDLIKFIKPGNS